MNSDQVIQNLAATANNNLYRTGALAGALRDFEQTKGAINSRYDRANAPYQVTLADAAATVAALSLSEEELTHFLERKDAFEVAQALREKMAKIPSDYPTRKDLQDRANALVVASANTLEKLDTLDSNFPFSHTLYPLAGNTYPDALAAELELNIENLVDKAIELPEGKEAPFHLNQVFFEALELSQVREPLLTKGAILDFTQKATGSKQYLKLAAHSFAHAHTSVIENPSVEENLPLVYKDKLVAATERIKSEVTGASANPEDHRNLAKVHDHYIKFLDSLDGAFKAVEANPTTLNKVLVPFQLMGAELNNHFGSHSMDDPGPLSRDIGRIVRQNPSGANFAHAHGYISDPFYNREVKTSGLLGIFRYLRHKFLSHDYAAANRQMAVDAGIH